MENSTENSKPIFVQKNINSIRIGSYANYTNQLINYEQNFWQSPSPILSFDTHQLGKDNIPPPFGKTPPNNGTPINLKILNFMNKSSIKINNFKATSPKNNTINTKINNQDDIFYLEM